MRGYENDCNWYNEEMFRLISNYERTKKVVSMLDTELRKQLKPILLAQVPLATNIDVASLFQRHLRCFVANLEML